MTACQVCSGATDVPDGRGGIMPCPECSAQVHIRDIGLNTRAYNSLMNAMLPWVHEVAARTDAELLSIPNFGRGSLAEVRRLIPYKPPKQPPLAAPRRTNESFGKAAPVSWHAAALTQRTAIRDLNGDDNDEPRSKITYADWLKAGRWFLHRIDDQDWAYHNLTKRVVRDLNGDDQDWG